MFEGLSAMGLGLLVGAVAGRLVRTRWAMLVAPLTFVVVSSWPGWASRDRR